jgi:hypothetical protein
MESGPVHDQYLMANAPEARAFANMLDSIGLLHPRMIPTAQISKLNTKAVEDVGFLDILAESGSICSVVGWAVLPKSGTRAHCVVLSYEDPRRGPIAFSVAEDMHSRPDVAAALHNPASENSGWSGHFDRSSLPPGDLVVRAWAFDANRAILYQLGTPKIVH